MIDTENKTDWQHTMTLQVGGQIAFRLDHLGICETAIGFGNTLDEAIYQAVNQLDEGKGW